MWIDFLSSDGLGHALRFTAAVGGTAGAAAKQSREVCLQVVWREAVRKDGMHAIEG